MGYGIAFCKCGNDMSSGEECRLYQATGHCFACYPGNLLALLMGEEEDMETEDED